MGNLSPKNKQIKMGTLKVTREQFDAALNVANDETKSVLIALFGEKEPPTLDNYESIKSYEDACKALGEDEQDFDGMESDVVAYIKLKTISRALWGRDFVPLPDAIGSKTYYYPWFALYTQEEIDRMDEDDRESLLVGALLARGANTGAHAGFGFLHAGHRSSHAYASAGFRLCQETPEKARYFGKQFIELWAEYTLFRI